MQDGIVVRISSLGNDVGGVSPGKDRKTIFVRGALPGELVRCRPEKESGSFIRAELLDVLEPSPHRIPPLCSYHGVCGGCSLQHLDYGRQLHWKRQWVLRALSRTGVSFGEETVSNTLPSPRLMGYRNRVSFDMTPDGPGLHMLRGDPIPVRRCPLLNETGSRIFSRLAGRHLDGCHRISVRASDRTSGAMVEYSSMPSGGLPGLDGGVISAWRSEGGWKFDGEGRSFTEELLGLTFAISAGSFFQVNTDSAELLVRNVLDRLPPHGRIMDLYGGCGTFALPATSAGAEVVSVELDPVSSGDGAVSASWNGLSGVEFITCRARHYLQETVNGGARWDSVIVDPPRAGLGIRDSRLLRRVDASRIFYVSCNPFSLGRDLAILCERHWQVAGVTPVDMFPQTDHVETVTELRRAGEG
jgi:23S rRNA (uracil1939-C5)-methyltransferase